jgi:putative phosphoribosyl transferase
MDNKRGRVVHFSAGNVHLTGEINLVEGALGIVVFAHASSRGHTYTDNHYLANILSRSGLSTFLFDMLTPTEHQLDRMTRDLSRDIDLLATRLSAATHWLSNQRASHSLKIGYFADGTAAAAALTAASERPDLVRAVVTLDGQVQLAESVLSMVRVPTMLVASDRCPGIIEKNRKSLSLLETSEKRLSLIETKIQIEEAASVPPAEILDRVGELARSWFLFHLLALEEQGLWRLASG